jgi:uncharacterized protein YaaN involved in tellurite resistance
MSRTGFNEITDILNLGALSQNRLAELNSLVTKRINDSDHSGIYRLFDELLAIAEEKDVKIMAAKEKQLDELESALSEKRIELLKDAKLLDSLILTNVGYIAFLEDDIAVAKEYLDSPIAEAVQDAYTLYDTMQKRYQELVLTKNVATAFSEQIRLSENTLLSLASRIAYIRANFIPLLRGRISAETARILAAELKKNINDL